MPLTNDSALAALRTVIEPDLRKDVVTLGMVKRLDLDGPDVRLALDPADSPHADDLVRACRRALVDAGADTVAVDLAARKPLVKDRPLPQIARVVAVGAGKGGVGKSTVAVNLAVGLARTGMRVGLLDGDIYGPSLPTLLGVQGRVPEVVNVEGGGQKIVPLRVHGVHAITIGSLVDREKPLVWRGPMAHGAFRQLLLDNTLWPELDLLIVDLPPGTGDVPLTLCQLLAVTGAVVVATPQQVALDDATRAVRMFQQLGTPVLGVVENMSVYVAPDGSAHDLFGQGGARAMAERMGLPFLGELPLFPELRKHSDAGTPMRNFTDGGALSEALFGLSAGLARVLESRGTGEVELEVT